MFCPTNSDLAIGIIVMFKLIVLQYVYLFTKYDKGLHCILRLRIFSAKTLDSDLMPSLYYLKFPIKSQI